jgi:hypothetical protein
MIDFRAAVISLQDAKQIGLKRLGTEADPIDTGFDQDVGLFGVERPGIGLDGDLGLAEAAGQ